MTTSNIKPGDLYHHIHPRKLGLLFDNIRGTQTGEVLELGKDDIFIVLDVANLDDKFEYFTLSKYGLKKIFTSDLKKFCEKI